MQSLFFPNPSNPFETSFPEIFSINEIDEHIIADFTAIKIGDVNGSANTLDFTNIDSRNTEEPLIFEVENQTLEAGKTYDISFNSKGFKSIFGFQFTLNFDTQALDFQGLTSSSLDGF